MQQGLSLPFYVTIPESLVALTPKAMEIAMFEALTTISDFLTSSENLP